MEEKVKKALDQVRGSLQADGGDVEFVERRRFSQAADMERRGQARPVGAPPVGVSPGAELVLAGSWAPASADSAYLDFRLTRAETGEVVTTFRRSTPISADPT